METINVRYGSTFNFSVENEDIEADTVTLYVAKTGEEPVITIPATFAEGIAFINSTEEDTRVPLGGYNYMLTVRYSDGRVHKYPTSDECEEDGLPSFNVLEALDETEVV
jgi:hypothetical protein